MPPTTRKATGRSSVRGKKGAVAARAAEGVSVDKNLKKLHEIVQILESSGLAELRYEDADVAVELRRHSSASVLSMPSLGAGGISPTARAEAPAEAEPPEADVHLLRSPFVGTFYASPSPGAEVFTAVGRSVRRGQTLCIVEAMKLMNEIESEVDGIVLEVLVENGKPVQYGDALFKIRTKA